MKCLETQGEAENIVWYAETKNKKAKRGTKIISNTNHFQNPYRISKWASIILWLHSDARALT